MMNPTPVESGWTILVPFDRREGLSLKEAADVAGKSGSTIRAWCQRDGIGRRVGGGTWVVSRLALRMFLDGDDAALRAYLEGVRLEEPVASYYRRLGLDAVLDEMKAAASRAA
jgi:hypothetical protein